MSATTTRPVPAYVKLTLLILLLGALAAIFLIHPGEAQGQGLKSGVGYDPFPGRPDPWAAVQAACGWSMGGKINTVSDPSTLPPGDLQRSLWEAKIREIVQQTGLTPGRALECLALGQSLYRQRYGAGPPSAGQGILEASQAGRCGSEMQQLAFRDLGILWRAGHPAVGGPEFSGVPVIREYYDWGWACPRHLHCEATKLAGILGYSPANPEIVACRPGAMEGHTPNADPWGCTHYWRQRPECSEPDPEPDPEPQPDPEPEPPPPITSCPAGQDCRPPCPECPGEPESCVALDTLTEAHAAMIQADREWSLERCIAATPDGRWRKVPDGKFCEGVPLWRARRMAELEGEIREVRAQCREDRKKFIPGAMSTGHLEIEVKPGKVRP